MPIPLRRPQRQPGRSKSRCLHSGRLADRGLEMAIRIGVVGVGFGTTVHVPAFISEGLEVVAVMARRRERAAEAAATFGIEGVFTDFDELLDMPGLDAVSIATPTAQHYEMATAALRAGKHVICEKPFALNVTEAKEMADLAQASGLTAMIAHEFRFASGRMFVKSLLDDGYLGEPQVALLRLLRGPAAAPSTELPEYLAGRDAASEGAGFLFGLGSHYIDGLRHWFGEVEEVSGTLRTLTPNRRSGDDLVLADADDTFGFTLRFASGVVADMVATRNAPFVSESTISIYGDGGTLVTPQHGFNPPAHGTVLGGRLGIDDGLVELKIPAELEPFSDDRDDRLMPFRIFTREFLRGIAEGSSPAPNFVDGWRCQQILDAVRISSATGQRVRIGD
jgi:predicted dehydrogenase